MLRTALRTHPRAIIHPTRRGLVSSVLLTRPYQERSLAELKQEAKQRGLAQYGSKSSLIGRITAEDQRRAQEELTSSQPAVAPQQVRKLSTAPQPAKTSSAAPQSRQNLDIKLPDISQPAPQEPVQIPFVPDFWESSKVNAAKEHKSLGEEPKIVVTAGVSTHPAGGPSHNLYHPDLDPPTESLHHEAPGPPSTQGFWQDVAEDLNVPTTLPVTAQRDPNTQTDSGAHKSRSRPLTDNEQKGVWMLLGIIAGSWLAGGLATPSQAKKTKSAAETHSH